VDKTAWVIVISVQLFLAVVGALLVAWMVSDTTRRIKDNKANRIWFAVAVDKHLGGMLAAHNGKWETVRDYIQQLRGTDPATGALTSRMRAVAIRARLEPPASASARASAPGRQ
jgi:hypothetical protein